MTTLKRRLTRLQTNLWILFESGDLEAEKYKRKDVIITSSYMKIEQSVGFLELGCTLTRVESDKRGDKIQDLLLWNPFFKVSLLTRKRHFKREFYLVPATMIMH